MPKRPRKPCAQANCPRLIAPGQRYCPDHKKREQQYYDSKRDKQARKLYNYRWEKYAKQFLKQHPLCQCEECADRIVPLPSEAVDHKIPHKGDPGLFWDGSNHQAMAKVCHDRKTAREDGGWGRGV